MLGLRFSRLPRHRKFSYTPLYYDEDKEKLHAHVDRIKREMGEMPSDQKSVEENIRRAFREKQGPDRYSANPLAKFYSLRILLIASILGLVFYKLLESDFLVTIFEKFSN
jgi:hypothetical protein